MICKICLQDKTNDDFYKNGTRLAVRCKTCIAQVQRDNRAKRPTGFAKLPKETQEGIFKAIKENKLRLKYIAQEYGVEYVSLWNWVKKGQVVMPAGN